MNPKKKKPLPKTQPAGDTNPESEAGSSKKPHDAPKEKRKTKDWVDKIHWFGE